MNRKKIFCNTCNWKTHHDNKFEYERYDSNIDIETDSIDHLTDFEQWRYRVWVCRGCETGSLEEEHIRWVDEEEFSESIIYPIREHDNLSLKVFQNLEPKLDKIYQEVIQSFNNNSVILCSIGLRALLEGICAEKNVKGRNLVQKIDGLKDYLPNNIVNSLHGFRFMGNEAAHELQAPSLQELESSIDVMEDLLNYLYELDYKARSFYSRNLPPQSSHIHPSPRSIKNILEREPTIPNGQKKLYKELYLVNEHGLNIFEMAEKMDINVNQISGVLGALGNRINRTEGISGSPGINYVFEPSGIDVSTGKDKWRLRPELIKVLEDEKYPWSNDWIKNHGD